MLTTRTARHQLALKYARAGFEVLPLEGKEPASCLPHRRKGEGGVKLATRDLHQLDLWWAKGDWNIGLRVPVGMFVLDSDHYRGGGTDLDALEARYGALPTTLTTITGKGDGSEHLWFRGDATRLTTKLYPGVDLRGRNNYLVAPGSIHPETELEYRWNTDEGKAPVDAPEWIYEALGRTEPVAYDGKTAVRTTLTAYGVELVYEGRKRGGDVTVSGVAWSALWSCGRAGMSPAQMVALAANPAAKGLHAYYLARGAAGIASQAARALELMGGAEPEVFAELRKITTWIGDQEWTGQRGKNARALAKLMVSTGYAARSLTVRMSALQMMTGLNVASKNTAKAARDYLVSAGFMAQTDGPEKIGGAAFTLAVPDTIETRTGRPVVALAHDLFSRAGLGKSGLAVLEALADLGSGSTADVVAVAGVASSTAYRVLGRALAAGAVSKSGRTWTFVGELDRAADVLGATGHGVKVAAQVERLRDARAAGLIRLRTTRHAVHLRAAGASHRKTMREVCRELERQGYAVLESGSIVVTRTGVVLDYDVWSLLPQISI